MQARHAELQSYLKSNLPDIVYSFNRQNALVSLEATALTTSAIPSQKRCWIELCWCSLVFPALPWFLPLPAQLAAAAAVSKIPLPAMGSTRPPTTCTPTRKVNSMQSKETPMQRETAFYCQFSFY